GASVISFGRARRTAVARRWTRLYTRRLPAAVRDRRHAEIESDLWESQREVTRHASAAGALHILVRFVLGIPDDLGWWVEQAAAAGVLRQKTIVLTGRVAGVAIMAGTLLAIDHDAARDRALVVFAPRLP